MNHTYTLGIDIGSTTVKIAILDDAHQILFSDYKRHFANIRETLSSLLQDAYQKLGNLTVHPVITGSGGLTLANHLKVPFVQEVVAVATSLKETFALIAVLFVVIQIAERFIYPVFCRF